jgi:hypothetical protein
MGTLACECVLPLDRDGRMDVKTPAQAKLGRGALAVLLLGGHFFRHGLPEIIQRHSKTCF